MTVQYRHELTPHLQMYIGWVGCAKKVHSLSPIKKTTMLFNPKPHWGFHQCVTLHCSCISQKCFMLKMRSKFQLLSGLAVTEVHITNFLFLWISTWFFYTWQIYWPWLLGEPPWLQGEPPWLRGEPPRHWGEPPWLQGEPSNMMDMMKPTVDEM